MKRHGRERNWTRLPKWGKGRPLEGMTSVLGPEDRNKGTKSWEGRAGRPFPGSEEAKEF